MTHLPILARSEECPIGQPYLMRNDNKKLFLILNICLHRHYIFKGQIITHQQIQLISSTALPLPPIDSLHRPFKQSEPGSYCQLLISRAMGVLQVQISTLQSPGFCTRIVVEEGDQVQLFGSGLDSSLYRGSRLPFIPRPTHLAGHPSLHFFSLARSSLPTASNQSISSFPDILLSTTPQSLMIVSSRCPLNLFSRAAWISSHCWVIKAWMFGGGVVGDGVGSQGRDQQVVEIEVQAFRYCQSKDLFVDWMAVSS